MKLNIANLLQLEQNCRNAKNYDELKHIIVNETKRVVSYKQAFLLSNKNNKSLEVDAISNIYTVDKSSVYVQTIQKLASDFFKENKDSSSANILDINRVETYYKKILEENSAKNILIIPLILKKEDATITYYLVLVRDEDFLVKEQEIGNHLSKSLAFFIYANKKCDLKSKISLRGYYKYIFIFLVLCMFIPVKLSVLAPLEVVAKNPFIVTSPLKGAVKSIEVSPNEYISKGDLVLSLDKTDYENRYILAKKSLQIAQAKLKTAQQGSFYNTNYKAEIDKLKAEAELAKSKLEFAKKQLDKTLIYAKKDGVAVLNNPSKWEGKPVITGEKIFLIANKNEVELEISLLVSDAIFLTKNAKVKAFLDNDPLSSWDATIKHISYEPQLTSKKQLVYKITASFDDLKQNEYFPTIGLRGSAKIYSQEVTLFFYLFRKPITKLREYIGW